MSIVHDRKFVRRYANVVHWRGAWMSARASLRGFLSGVTLSILLYAARVSNYVSDYFEFLLDDLGIGEFSFPLLESISQVVFYNNLTLLFIPVLTVGIALLNARFEFWRFLAEAQALIAATETADNTSSDPPSHPPTTGRTWPATLAAIGAPTLALGIWVLLFRTFIMDGSAPRIEAIYTTSEEDLYVIEFSEPLSRYSAFVVSIKNPNFEQSVELLSTHLPATLICRSNAVMFRTGVIVPEPVPEPSSPRPTDEERAVFFEEDDSTLDPSAQATVNRLALWLRENPGQQVLLVGGASELGTNEYRIALATRRAFTVQEALVGQGVSTAQIFVDLDEFEFGESDCDGENCRAAFQKVSVIELPPDFVDPVIEAPVVVEEGYYDSEFSAAFDLPEPFARENGDIQYSEFTIDWSVLTGGASPQVTQSVNRLSSGRWDDETEESLTRRIPTRICPAGVHY